MTDAAVDRQRLLTLPYVLLLCVQFCFGLSYSTFFLLPKYLAREFDANSQVIGAVAAAALVAGVVATPWMGAWLDRGSRRPFVSYGALVNGLSGAAFAVVHSLSWPIYALRIVQGVSYALVFNATLTLAADLTPPKKLGQALGLTGAAGMVANAIAPALAESIADQRGWPLVFVLAGCAALFAAALSLAIQEPRHIAQSARPNAIASATASASSELSAASAPLSALALSRHATRIGAFVCSVANGAAFGVMFTFTQPYALSLGAARVSSFFIGYTATALSVRLFLGGLADTLGRRRIAFAALMLYGLVVFMTSLLRPNLLFVVGACLGLAHGLLYPAINALAVEGVPRERRGAVMSYFFGAFNCGFAAWVFGSGLIAKTQGYPVVFVSTGLLCWCAVPFLRQSPQPKAPPASATT